MNRPLKLSSAAWLLLQGCFLPVQAQSPFKAYSSPVASLIAHGDGLPALFSAYSASGPESKTPAVTAGANPNFQAPPLLARWLQLDELSYAGRYRKTVTSEGRALFAFGQERYAATGAFKLDTEGKYEVFFHASSGRYFNWSYADFIWGSTTTIRSRHDRTTRPPIQLLSIMH